MEKIRTVINFLVAVFITILVVSFFSYKTFAQSSSPYGGIPWSIPGTIQIEDYDLGGEGVAYHDADSSNKGGQYRNDGVDIQITQDGSGSSYEVFSAVAGEWLQYTVNVSTTGTYQLMLRGQAVSSATGGKVHLEVDGINKSGTISIVPGTWQGLTTIYVPGISLTAGQHLVKLVMDTNSTAGVAGAFNWMRFDLTSPLPTRIPVVIPTPGSVVFYVSPTGNDSNAGTLAQPWKTITKAANTLTAGQTVYIRGSTYNEILTPKNSGTNNNYIIYSSYSGETVTLDASGLAISQIHGIVDLYNKSYIRITGLRIVNAGVNVSNGHWNEGVTIQNSDHIVIDHNYVNHTYSSGVDIGLFSSEILIDNNEVDATNFGETESCLATFWFANNVEVRNNYVHNCPSEGINAVTGAHDVTVHNDIVSNGGGAGSGLGIYTDAWTEHTYNINIYNNISHDNNGAGFALSSEAGGLLENVNLYNNISYNNGTWGILISNFPWDNAYGSYHPMKNINIINNTIYGNDTSSSGQPGIAEINPDATGVVIRNNISSRNLSTNYPLSQLTVNDPANATVDHNLFYGASSYLGNNYVQGNPLFINLSGGDFHLQSGSPAINVGSATNAPAFDFDGNLRPAGAGYDIGAYEYGSSPGPTNTPVPTSTLVPSLTPTISIGNGDANGDGVVNSKDLLTVFQNYNKSLGLPTDQYGDGLVNMLDLNVVLSVLARTTPTPTPTTIPSSTPTPTPSGPTPTPAASVYPLKASANKRYLVDQNNVPFLMMGDSPQALIGMLSEADAGTYFADRKNRGFNAAWVSLLCLPLYYSGCHSDGSLADGSNIKLFNGTFGDLTVTNLNDTYFTRVDHILNIAQSYGIVVLLDPIETGSWLQVIRDNNVVDTNGHTKDYNFGVYLGNRYKNFPNIVWLNGNDFQSWRTSSDDAAVTEVAKGIKSTDTNHLQTVELDYNDSGSLDDSNWAPIIGLDSAYSYYPQYNRVLQEYNRTNFIPVYFIEGDYENQTYAPAPTTHDLRAQEYWSQLSGTTGQLYGNANIYPFLSGWQNNLNSVSTREFGYETNLFASRSWCNLVPDQSHTVVTSGYGTYDASTIYHYTSNYVATARASDGSLIISYIPVRSSSTNPTVDMTKLSGTATARWYDPTTGTYQTITGSPFANSGSHQFSPPSGNHTDGTSDWVLVLQVN